METLKFATEYAEKKNLRLIENSVDSAVALLLKNISESSVVNF